MTPKSAAPDPNCVQSERRHWMAVLARAPIDLLRASFEDCPQCADACRLVGPETGLIQLRAKAPVTETAFHLGEATVSRCVVELAGRRGYGVVLGSDLERAELVAVFDALLQDPQMHGELRPKLLQSAESAISVSRQRRANTAQATAAHFFTAARGGKTP